MSFCATIHASTGEQFCSDAVRCGYLERSGQADVVCPHIHKIKQIAECPEDASMRKLRLLSTTAAILLLGVCAVSAQGIKTNETSGAPPAAQQNAPPEKMAPALKSDQSKASATIGQAAPTAPKTDKLQTTDKGAPAGVAAKGSSDASSSVDAKSMRTAHNSHRRHFAGRYEGGRGPLYDSYGGQRGYRGCRDHGHGWTLGLWC